MLNKRILKAISISLVGLSLSGLFERKAYAIGDNGNLGGGGSGANTGTSFTWDDPQSGYRLSIVDKDGKLVSNVVDILYSTPATNGIGFGNNYYTNPKTGGLSNAKSNYDWITFELIKDAGLISKFPQFPVYYSNGNFKAGGNEFKEYFLKGRGGINEITHYTPAPSYSVAKPQYVQSGYGTSKPSLEPIRRPVTDMQAYSEYAIINSSGTRAMVKVEAYSKVMELGTYSHALTSIS